MALSDLMPTFIWGPGGARMTPEEIARERKVADALQTVDTSPVQHWTQGAARVANALAGSFRRGAADEAAQANAGDNSKMVANALAGIYGGAMSGAASAPAPAAASAPSAPNPSADVIKAGLIQRGIPDPVAQGFVMNFRDESGLNPAINEAAPLVPGSRGGYGLAQWTGPRRNALEQFAATAGKPVSDLNTQLDYLVNELQGPEAKAAQSIMAATTPQDAAVAIARDFLRPSPENLDRRIAQYAASQPAAPVQLAAAPPQTMTDASPVAAAVAPQQPMPSAFQEAPGMQRVAQALVPQPPSAPTIPAPQGSPPTRAGSGINPAILKAMTSPYADERTQKIGQLLFQNTLQQQGADAKIARELAARQNAARSAGIDPSMATDAELWKQAVAAKYAAPSTATVGRTLIDTRTGKPIFQGQQDAPTSVNEYEYYQRQAQAAGQQPKPYLEWDKDRRKAGATNINTGDAENAFQKEAGKATATRFNDLVADGQQAKQLMSDMGTLLDLGKGIGTGKGAQVKATLGPFAEAAGLKVDGLSDIQAYEAIINRVAPSLRVKGSGAQSDYELKNFLKSIPSLGNTQEGNEIAASVMQGLQQNKAMAADIASRALSGELSRTEAEKQLRNLPDPMQPYRDYKAHRGKVDSLLEKYGGRQ